VWEGRSREAPPIPIDPLALFTYHAYVPVVEDDMRFRALPSLAVACLCFFCSGRQGYSQQWHSESLSPNQVQELTTRNEPARPAPSSRVTSAHKVAKRHAAGVTPDQKHNNKPARKELTAAHHVQRCLADYVRRKGNFVPEGQSTAYVKSR